MKAEVLQNKEDTYTGGWGRFSEEVIVYMKNKEGLRRGARETSLYSFTVKSSPSVHDTEEALNVYLLNESEVVGKST